ncbi:hypothetical protein C8J57DRAFT_1183273 [Mycena rebaudengoi]|nr:hypothetical protein C8J57DRAFT_1183273 [Mycena rebaudengoi]
MATQSSQSSEKPPSERNSIPRRTHPPDKPLDGNLRNGTGRAPSSQDLRANRASPYRHPRNSTSKESVATTTEPSTPKKPGFRAKIGAAAATALGKSPNSKTRLVAGSDAGTSPSKKPTQQRILGHIHNTADDPGQPRSPSQSIAPLRFGSDHVGAPPWKDSSRTSTDSLFIGEGEADMDIEEGRGSPIEADNVETLARQIQTSLIEAVHGLKRINDATNGNAWNRVSEETKKYAEEAYVGALGMEWLDEILRKNKEDAIEAANNTQNLVQTVTESMTDAVLRLTERMELMENRMLTQFSALEHASKGTARPTPDNGVQATVDPRTSHATGPTFKPTRKGLQAATPPTKVIENPLEAHHPSRLIVQVLPEGLKPEERPDPNELVRGINARLAANDGAKHMKVVSTKWNGNGNCVVFTRADQTAKELLKFKDLFVDLIARDHQTAVSEDLKLLKIQVNGLRTGWFDTIPGLYTPDLIHQELRKNNPAFAKLNLVLPARWMRSAEELKVQMYSSIVFAIEDNEEARHLLRNVKSFAAFGRNTFLRRYADHPPFTQCKKCWKLTHVSTKCDSDKPKCRLCDGDHTESEHRQNCTQCKAEREAEGVMDVDGQVCTHNLKCTNCKGKEDNRHASDSRRCPERLLRYGTARENEKPQQTQGVRTQDNGWQDAPVRRPRNDTTAQAPPANPNSNRFNVFSDDVTGPGPVSQDQIQNIIATMAEKGIVMTNKMAETAAQATIAIVSR